MISLGSHFPFKRFITCFVCHELEQQIFSWRDKVQFGVALSFFLFESTLCLFSLLSPELPLGGEYSCLGSKCSPLLFHISITEPSSHYLALCPFRGVLPDLCQTHLKMVIIMQCALFILAGTHPPKGHYFSA